MTNNNDIVKQLSEKPIKSDSVKFGYVYVVVSMEI